jgi:hypothetical protein
MRFELSCIAASELLQCNTALYIHFNDEVLSKS